LGKNSKGKEIMFYLDLEFWRGTTFGPVKIYAKDSDGNTLNLTGWTVAAKTDYFDLGASITDPTSGEVTMEVSQADTANIELGKYKWDMLLTNQEGDVLGPYIGGTVRTYQPVT
jgi:hypothetical protein